MAVNRWKVAQGNKELSRQISEKYNISRFAAHLLVTRGLSSHEDIIATVDPLSVPLCDPLLLKDMDKAVARINRALDKGERIAIFGDYDVDGITSTAILYSYLCDKEANIMYLLPCRDDGYGLSKSAVDRFVEYGVNLIITVDNGISAYEEIKYAKSLGIDTVVTDHHRPPELLPDADAIVDPHRVDETAPYKDFTGAGVAFMLCCALEGNSEIVSEKYVDLAALGTIADIAPLTGDNRAIVARGLKKMQTNPCIGLEAIMEVTCLQKSALTSTDVSYVITPRLNAAGRLGDPDRAVKLMLCKDYAEADLLASELHEGNKHRHDLEKVISEEAWKLIAEDISIINDRVVVICGKGWHHGVLGIFAARLCEQLGKPCVVLSDEDGVARGSARSLGDFSIHAAFTACSHLLLAYGGHTLAAGMQIATEKVDEFRKAINEYAAGTGEMPVAELDVDCELPPEAVDIDLYKQASVLEPFGANNPSPVVLIRGLKLTKIFPCGGDMHHRLTLQKNGQTFTAMYFNISKTYFPFVVGDELDCVFTLGCDIYRGAEKLKLTVKDIRLSCIDSEELIAASRAYDKLLRGEHFTSEEAEQMLPSREDFAKVYLYISRRSFRGGLDTLSGRLCSDTLNCKRLYVALDALCERGLITIKRRNSFYLIEIINTIEKMDLNLSPMIIRLREYIERRDTDAVSI